jgi:hypothetical protein
MPEPIVRGEETLGLARRRSEAEPQHMLSGQIGVAVNQRRTIPPDLESKCELRHTFSHLRRACHVPKCEQSNILMLLS